MSHSGTALYNGNISETEWRTANTDNALKWYRYGYDPLNRITSATASSANYHLSSVSYDKNGNILTLNRKGHTNSGATTFGIMDDLVYTYDSGNKLTKVLDNGNDDYGFKDLVNQTTEYTYDANGNMLTDANKGITGITYNHLNLPTAVTTAQGTISYIYDAAGTKLQKTAGGSVTQYSGNYIYQDGNLEFFTHPEGYAYPNGNGGYDYVYNYTDHLGSVRLSYSDIDGNGSIDPSTEILQELNYYPGGLIQKGYNNVVQGTQNKHQTYQGQELEEELGKDTYAFQWRDYDPATLRMGKIDRFAEKYYDQSPYSFSQNNPIRFNEIKGDSLWINYKGNRILYENGNLSNRDGTAYTGKGVKVQDDGTVKLSGFLKKAVGALNDIRNGGASGNELVSDLQNDASHVFISKGNNSARGTRVSWNPSDKDGGINQDGSTKRPAYVGLAHELGHAHDALDGSVANSPTDVWFRLSNNTPVYNAETYASHWENRIRGENGLSLRTHYGIDSGTNVGSLLNTNGASNHFTQSQVMPSVQLQSQGSSLNGTFKIVPVPGTTTVVIPFKYK